jgi:nicotinate-nucleotide pyrophosphorylase
MARKAVVATLDQTEIGHAKQAIQDLVKEILQKLIGSSGSVNVEAERFFFPHGVELIEVGATVGPKSTPVFEFNLKIAGAAGVHQASGLDTAPK